MLYVASGTRWYGKTGIKFSTDMDTDRYSRQTMLAEIGEEGQRRLSEAKVLVVGVGGLGLAAAVYLAGAGVGTIGLCDPDVVSLSNLQRQVLYGEGSLGMPKADMAVRRLADLNSSIKLIPVSEPVTACNAATVVTGYDVVLDCTDNFAVRYALDDACHEAGVPLVHGAIGEFAGEVAIFNGRCGTRYADLYPDREALEGAPRKTSGVLGALPGIIGAMQAAEAIKLIAGFGECLDGRLLTLDLLTMHTSITEI